MSSENKLNLVEADLQAFCENFVTNKRSLSSPHTIELASEEDLDPKNPIKSKLVSDNRSENSKKLLKSSFFCFQRKSNLNFHVKINKIIDNNRKLRQF